MPYDFYVPVLHSDPDRALNPRFADPYTNRIHLSVFYDRALRTYFLSACPEFVQNGIVQCVIGAGKKRSLLRVPRQSKGRAREAAKLAETAAADLVPYLCALYALTPEPTHIQFLKEEDV